MKFPFRFCIAAACLLLSAVGARADWTLISADFNVQKHVTVNEWSLKEGLSYTADNGKLTAEPTRQLVSLISDRPRNAGTGKWLLQLRNGDVLDGDPLALKGQAIQFRVTECGTIEVPLKAMTSLVSKESKKAPAPASDKDTVRLKNGDLLEGILAGLDADKVQMQSDLGTNAVEWARVDRLSLGGAVPARGLPALSVRITFLSGTVLTTSAFKWTLNDVVFNDPADQEHKCPADQVVGVEVLGGRVIWLTEIDPASDVQTSLFATRWPTQVNHNVLGGPLKIKNLPFDRGLGVHTQSVLTYDLDGSFTQLRLRAGLDDSSQPHGEANLSIVLDGKVIWQAKGMKAGQITEPLNLPIAGGKKLELHADPAGKMDVLGRVDWVNVALTRP